MYTKLMKHRIFKPTNDMFLEKKWISSFKDCIDSILTIVYTLESILFYSFYTILTTSFTRGATVENLFIRVPGTDRKSVV